jgi:hypothetical protein
MITESIFIMVQVVFMFYMVFMTFLGIMIYLRLERIIRLIKEHDKRENERIAFAFTPKTITPHRSGTAAPL